MSIVYYIVIKAHADDKQTHEIGPITGKRAAEKTEDGVNINLNHERFYTAIEEREK